MRRLRLTVGARLMVSLATLAGFSTFVALLSQDRALSHDLEAAAQARLQRASNSAALLLEQHLTKMAQRYAAISHTPEFRANLRTANAPTLTYYAGLLVKDQQARAVVFLDAADARIAAAGGDELVGAALAAAVPAPDAPSMGVSSHCIRVDVPAPYGPPPPPELPTPRFGQCTHPTPALQAMLLSEGNGPFAVAVVPLFEGADRVGTLIASDAIEAETVATWSLLSGADVAFGPPSSVLDPSTESVVHRAGDTWLVARQSLAIEREVLAHARQNLVAAGVLAAVAAMAASILLARSFVRPIREMQAATERVGRGDLESQVAISREDELGDVARAFNVTLARLRRSQERVEVAQRLARFSDWAIDVEAGLVEGSAEFARIFALDEEGPVALQALLERIHGEDRDSFRELLTSCGSEGRPFQVDVRSLDQNGDTRILHVQGQRVSESDGAAFVQASVQDVTQRKRFEEQIRLLAFDDSLTGIGNRRFFVQQLESGLARAATRGSGLALLFVDLDRFKNINDTMGHSAGDELLQLAGARIVAAVQEEARASGAYSVADVTIARLGGDEFTVLLPDVDSDQVAQQLALRLLEVLGVPCAVQGHQVVVTGSIGISLSPRDGTVAEDLVRSSDTAMYHAKRDGRNRFRFYESSMQKAAMERWQLENRLRRAIEREELRVHFQPRYRVETGLITQVEALLRWRDPELGAVSPDDFIAVAEESGLICGLGTWVMNQAVEQVRTWREEGWEIGVSVNLSSYQLQLGLVLEVAAALERTGVDSSWVEFEVTESALIADEEVGIDVLERLRGLGSRISLDDFGTGYSSLSQLSRLPVDALKIDRSFVEHIATDDDAAGLVGAIVATAKVLRLDVVAEGVETETQRELLEEMGCDEMQGFLFGHALSAEGLTTLLRETGQGKTSPEKKKRKKAAPRKRAARKKSTA